MKTLVINGSPRKDGNTAYLTNRLKNDLGGEFIEYFTYYAGVSHCMDCRFCWEREGCSIDDGMSRIYDLINTVDNIVLASPLYFSQPTGSLLGFASRFQTYYAQRKIRNDPHYDLKPKKGVLILTGGGDGSSGPAAATMKRILRMINAELAGTIISHQTDTVPSSKDINALNEIKNTALLLSNK